MATNFYTNDPKGLLEAFKTAIDDGHVTTWSYDDDGDFTHTAEQWKEQAWLRPVIYTDQLTLNFVINPETKKSPRYLYGVYHGRFIETMLVHCDTLFTNASASALATNADRVATSA